MVSTRPGSSSINKIRLGIPSRVLAIRCRGEPYGKCCSTPWHTFHTHRTSVRFYNSFDQIEAEAGSMDLIVNCALAAKKRFENALQLIGWYTGTVIANRDLDRQLTAHRD